jgi:transcriptional regulator with XRE-family HTH domain
VKQNQNVEYVVQTAAKRQEKLHRSLTRVINNLLAQRDWNRQRLADKTGVPHSTFSAIGSENRRWSLDVLMRVAVVFNVRLSDVIKAAETQDDVSVLMIHIAGTEPKTRERLNKITAAAAPEGTPSEVVALHYNADMMALAAPSYVTDYMNGLVSDPEVYEFLNEVRDSLGEGETFWGKVATIVNERK